jgi:hypothetical protein
MLSTIAIAFNETECPEGCENSTIEINPIRTRYKSITVWSIGGMRQRKKESDGPEQSDGRIDRSPMKRLRLDPNVSQRFIDLLDQNHINEDTLHSSLVESIDTDPPKLLDSADYNENDDDVCTKATIAAAAVDAVPLYIIPLFNLGDDAAHDICHPIFTFRPIVPLLNVTTDC